VGARVVVEAETAGMVEEGIGTCIWVPLGNEIEIGRPLALDAVTVAVAVFVMGIVVLAIAA
jgi:hypothetical protein